MILIATAAICWQIVLYLQRRRASLLEAKLESLPFVWRVIANWGQHRIDGHQIICLDAPYGVLVDLEDGTEAIIGFRLKRDRFEVLQLEVPDREESPQVLLEYAEEIAAAFGKRLVYIIRANHHIQYPFDDAESPEEERRLEYRRKKMQYQYDTIPENAGYRPLYGNKRWRMKELDNA